VLLIRLACTSAEAYRKCTCVGQTNSRSGSPNPAVRAARCCPSAGAGHDRRVSRPAACRSHCQPLGRWKMPFEFPILLLLILARFMTDNQGPKKSESTGLSSKNLSH